MPQLTATDVVSFWRDAGFKRWFQGGQAFDEECRLRLADAHHAAARRERDAWLDTAEGALALLILLDQVPRNIFRGSGHSFATDPLALSHARRTVDAGLDRQIEAPLRLFIYLPFEHSEDRADQQRSVALFETLGDETTLRYAIAHREVIEKFGRFPHRNRALGRINTPEEQAYLDAGGGFG